MRLMSACLAILSAVCLPAPAVASDPFADLTPLSTASLEEARGGIEVAGLNIDVGVFREIQGQLVSQLVTDPHVLERVLTASGQSVHSAAFGPDGESFSPVLVVENTLDDLTLSTLLRVDVIVDPLPGTSAPMRVDAFESRYSPPVPLSFF